MIAQHIENELKKYGLMATWVDAWEWYSFDVKSKHYHNMTHAQEVVERLFALTPEPSLQLLIAAKWHDAVYVPGAGFDANERCSAAALNVSYQRIRKNLENPKAADAVILEAQRMILNTVVSNHLMETRVTGGVFGHEHRELAVLLDADLGSLADPYERFLNHQTDIIKENFGTVEEHSKNSAQFLVRFLQVRECIYHTDKARELWEEKARANIHHYAQANGVNL